MRGQLVFEFLVAAVLFFAVVVYILSALGSSVAGSSERSQADVTQANAVAIAELLVSQQGVWDLPTNRALVIGLALEPQTLDPAKLAALHQNCSFPNSPVPLLPFLNLDNHPFNARPYSYNITIQISGALGYEVNCGEQPIAILSPTVGVGRAAGTATRAARLPTGELLTVTVSVW